MPRYLSLSFAVLLLSIPESLAAQRHDAPKHYIFVGRDRQRLVDSAFIASAGIQGAQVKYTWRDVEPQRDRYEFGMIADDLALLTREGKRLWIQLQDVSFSPGVRVIPDYLFDDPAFGGGAADQYEDDSSQTRVVGEMARRWDPAVRARFAQLLDTLGRAFDGKIEGLNFAETAFGLSASDSLRPAGFTYDGYAHAIRSMMASARAAFRRSHVIVYANFMPGEWLPGDDRGYLSGVYAYADSIGVGVGGPDLLPGRRAQRKHSLQLIAKRGANTVAALAVQDGNLAEVNAITGARVSVEELIRYATDTLRLDYLFWGLEEPYYSRDVLPRIARARR